MSRHPGSVLSCAVVALSLGGCFGNGVHNEQAKESAAPAPAAPAPVAPAPAAPMPAPVPVATPMPSLLPGGPAAWELVWQDEFTGSDQELDAVWQSQNGPSGHILCSRWRDNAVLGDDTLKLINRKENRGGQAWTSGNLWTKRQFQYGYFECRYRYAAAPATNNSFWLMPTGKLPEGGIQFEIDINEGHYPNEVNTNIHNHSAKSVVNGKKTHPTSPKAFQYGSRPDVRVQLENPITTRRIRISSRHGQHIHLDQVRVFAPSDSAYPEPLEPVTGQVDHAREAGVTIAASGFLKPEQSDPRVAIDGVLGTRWVSQKDGDKWLELTLPGDRTVGCIEFVNGWKNPQGGLNNLLDDYRLDYHDGKGWVPLSTFDIHEGAFNFARDFQVLGLDWTAKELVFYLNGREIRRVPNTYCHDPAAVWLSLAIIPWAGQITDALHGTSMEVDYVRVYKRR